MINDEADLSFRHSVARRAIVMKKNEKTFPDQVFSGQWKCFLFFQSDYIFSSDFVLIVQRFLEKEAGSVACLLNLDKVSSLTDLLEKTFFIDGGTLVSEYEAALRNVTRGLPWIFDVNIYICTSDIGEWCIYCEKGDDVAVSALRESSGKAKFSDSLQLLHAEAIDDLLSNPSAAAFPFNELVPSWVAGLTENYGRRA